MSPATRNLIKEIEDYYGKPLDKLTSDEWDSISGWDETWEDRLTDEFLNTYAEYLNFNILGWGQVLSDDFIRQYSELLDWNDLLEYQKMSLELIEEFSDEIGWENISKIQNLPESFIEEHADKLNWKHISNIQNLSLPFIEKHRDKIDFVTLAENPLIEHITNNFEEYPEWTDVLLRMEKDINDAGAGLAYSELKSVLKEKFTDKKYWKNYINYLKEKYPDKNVFEFALIKKIEEISKIMDIKEEEILNIFSDKKEKEINTDLKDIK